MKKTLLIIPCILFCLNAYCQSLSVIDILKLKSGPKARNSLKSKSFELLGFGKSGSSFETYIKDGNTKNEEKVYFAGPSISYLTKNRVYVNTLLKQLQTLYQYKFKDDNATFTSYGYGDKYFTFSLNIAKATKDFSSLTVNSN